MELSRYALSPLREGDFTLYRGSGSGLAPMRFSSEMMNSRASVSPSVPVSRPPKRSEAPQRSRHDHGSLWCYRFTQVAGHPGDLCERFKAPEP